ncbi:helix-turn-helix domain-containing protein [Membranicola marinus]|uniref:Helix-turn-helix domain-containing protein n=1 Tax=Membranihabitans marinus TaxID=1227546 RepID=A0A953HPL0_9BACT|nr:helix-turn-helix domain-containing protein [Membranihabitans marinus]
MKVRIVKFNEKKEVILNQEELALKIGKHRPYISRIKKGKISAYPTFFFCLKLWA